MKRLLFLVTLGIVLFAACSNDTTYAELREREKRQIDSFVKKGCTVIDKISGDTLLHVPPIHVISEQQYRAAGNVCDLSRNDYIYLSDLEMYMQVVERGTGDMGRTVKDSLGHTVPLRGDTIAEGTTRRIYVRYVEYNIGADSIQTANIFIPETDYQPEIMSVTNTAGTLTGTFTSGIMMQRYKAGVPNGWLYPSTTSGWAILYADSKLAHVRIIVPSTEGRPMPTKTPIPASTTSPISPTGRV